MGRIIVMILLVGLGYLFLKKVFGRDKKEKSPDEKE